jgi:hypothetical protein
VAKVSGLCVTVILIVFRFYSTTNNANFSCSAVGQGLGARTGVSPPSAERILAHLDRARNGCKPMFKVDSMQRVLQIAQAACTDTQRSLYRNLFALLEDEEPPVTSGKNAPSTSKGRGRKTASSSTSNNYSSKHRNASNRTSLKELSDTSESSSEVRVHHSRLLMYRRRCDVFKLRFMFLGRGSDKT